MSRNRPFEESCKSASQRSQFPDTAVNLAHLGIGRIAKHCRRTPCPGLLPQPDQFFDFGEGEAERLCPAYEPDQPDRLGRVLPVPAGHVASRVEAGMGGG
jgi:hypothetical protein